MITKAELQRMSLAERRQLARFLAELDEPDAAAQDAGPPPDEHRPGEHRPGEHRPGEHRPGEGRPGGPDPYLRDPRLRRERRLALLILAGCCVILAGWIVLLSLTLPHRFDAHHWRAVWVNFDVFLLAAFAATAWALWRQRQVLILLLMVTGTMLCCDAWFDVGTSLKTSSIWMSLASAFFAELPLAILAFAGARRLLKATVEASLPVPVPVPAAAAAGGLSPAGRRRQEAAARGPGPSLRDTPLSGTGLDEALPRRWPQEHAERPRQSAGQSSGAE